MTQDSLHRLRFDLRFVHKPVAKRVTKVVIRPISLLAGGDQQRIWRGIGEHGRLP